MAEENPTSVPPYTLIGQYAHLFEQGDATDVHLLSDPEHPSSLITDGQRSQVSEDIILSFRKSCESFISLNAPRTAAYCSYRMAREYFAAGDLNKAKKLFDDIAGLYRQEGWITLLWDTLGYLRECSRGPGSIKDFILYSLELSSLPVFSTIAVESPDCKRAYGPAGFPTLSQRETIQQEVFSLLKGYTSDLIVEDDQPTSLTVDLLSPVRMAFLTSVAFHKQTMKLGSSARITVSIRSQLPHPVEIDQLDIQFNQPSCNLKVVNREEELTAEAQDHDTRIIFVPSLLLTTNKWLPMTFDISSGQSGKLECISVNVKVGNHFTFCCSAESPASMEDLSPWKFENLVETSPTKDFTISFAGQKYIQVEEPEPQVEVTLGASSPAFVGENFVVPVSIVSKGHSVHSAELKMNLVDARGGGMLMSPRDTETFSSDNIHVELLSVSGVFEDDSKLNSDGIRNIQQSFGVVSVPFLDVGQSWSCLLEIKWHRPKCVMLYVSLGYTPSTSTDSPRINVHKSLQIEGKIPFTITHRFMMPFRKEPLLLLPKTNESSPSTHRKISLPLNETSILIVSARNCSEVSLRLTSSLSIEPDSSQDSQSTCTVKKNDTVSHGLTLVVPGEEFKQVFAVTPKVNSPNLSIGTVHLKWARDTNLSPHSSTVIMKQNLPSISVETPPLVVSLNCPPHAVLGLPFTLYVKVRNNTNLLQEMNYTLGDSQSFVFTGPHTDSVFILPKSEHVISYKLLPLASGLQHLPIVTVTSVRYSAAMNPSLAATTVFVYPSEPNFDVVGQISKLVQAS